jgi:hypothetical protein
MAGTIRNHIRNFQLVSTKFCTVLFADCISWGSLDFPPPLQFQQVARSLPMMHLPAPKSCILCELTTQTPEPNLWSLANYPTLWTTQNLESNCGVNWKIQFCEHLTLTLQSKFWRT